MANHHNESNTTYGEVVAPTASADTAPGVTPGRELESNEADDASFPSGKPSSSTRSMGRLLCPDYPKYCSPCLNAMGTCRYAMPQRGAEFIIPFSGPISAPHQNKISSDNPEDSDGPSLQKLPAIFQSSEEIENSRCEDLYHADRATASQRSSAQQSSPGSQHRAGDLYPKRSLVASVSTTSPPGGDCDLPITTLSPDEVNLAFITGFMFFALILFALHGLFGGL